MKYLKVFTDFAGQIEALNDTEVGRLFRAMLSYAETGEVPDLKGNERFLWGTAKMSIDNQRDSYDNVCKTNKRIATERNEASRSVTERNEASQDKDKDKDKDKEEYLVFSNKNTCCGQPQLSEKISSIVDAWNSLHLANITKMTVGSTRHKMLTARLREYGETEILRAIENVRGSDFLNGHNNRGFEATFDWFIKPNNFPKVLDGNYNNRSRTNWIDEVEL